MSVSVGLDELRAKVGAAGPVAFLITVSDKRAPHLVSVTTEWDGDQLRAGGGKTTASNIARSPRVSLMWAAGVDPGYCLIVDGDATVSTDGDSLAVTPTRAVLHRLSGVTEGESCITVLSTA